MEGILPGIRGCAEKQVGNVREGTEGWNCSSIKGNEKIHSYANFQSEHSC